MAGGGFQAVALQLAANPHRGRHLVLHAQADLVVGVVVFGARGNARARAGAAEAVLGPGVLCTHSGQGREALGQRHGAHHIEVETVDPGLAGQRAEGHGVGGEAVLAEVEVATFDGDVAVELVAAEDLEGGVFFVAGGAGGVDPRQQDAGGARGIELRARLAHRAAAIEVAGVLRVRRRCQEGGQAGEAEQVEDGRLFHGGLSRVRDALRGLHPPFLGGGLHSVRALEYMCAIATVPARMALVCAGRQSGPREAPTLFFDSPRTPCTG
ncbi:hypothetical protein FQZ97_815090 [compost metagenome]